MKVTVSQVNAYVKQLLSGDGVLGDITISGEISGFKRHSSGHVYFSLKDESATIRCAFFKPYSLKLNFEPKDGAKVLARGRITLYERDGQYQLNVIELLEDGVGDLFAQFLKMKERLEKEGLFDNQFKKPIPKFAKKIGVATSPTGAVIQDIKNVAFRRCPNMSMVLAPVAVQGEDAPRSICLGLELLDKIEDVDVIILARGGGSMEDLWCFNSEEVARAIFKCKKPVISAVGHETDFTIADFVADLRAPTPSAAAEIAVFDYFEQEQSLDLTKKYIEQAIGEKISFLRSRILSNAQYFAYPEKMLEGYYQRIDTLDIRLDAAQNLKLVSTKARLENAAGKLDALSPLKTLSRGYSITVDEKGELIKDAKQLKKGEKIQIKFAKGNAKAAIEEIK